MQIFTPDFYRLFFTQFNAGRAETAAYIKKRTSFLFGKHAQVPAALFSFIQSAACLKQQGGQF